MINQELQPGDQVYVDLNYANGGYIAEVTVAGKHFTQIKKAGDEWTIMTNRLRALKTERIQAAAIFYDDNTYHPHQPFNIKDGGIVVVGLRHCVCIHVLNLMYKDDLKREYWEEGFVTSHNRFVDREEAALIALRNNQISELKYFKNELDSSDLY